MDDLSKKTVIIYDAGGDYTHLAEAIAPEFGRVYYYVPWESSFSTARGLMAGIGLPGIERCPDFFGHLEVADLVVFTDVGNYALTEYLRRQGMPVFGSGEGGKYETDRVLLKQLCAEIGVDCAEAMRIRGVEPLREILQKYNDLYVKISYLRGESETFHHTKWALTRDRFNRMAANLGPYGPLADFIVEIPIDEEDGPCCEIGFDTFCADGEFPDECLYGYEAKDAGYLGAVGPLPLRLAAIRDKLAPALRAVGYRGAISTETRETEKGSYLLDLTLRFGSPPSELMSKLISNLGEVMWDVAHGRCPTPEYRYRFGGQLVLKSHDFQEHSAALELEDPDVVAIHGHCIIDGQHYAVSPSEIEEMGAGVGMADTMEETIALTYEAADTVKGDGVKYDASALSKVLELINEGCDKLDLTWGGYVPTPAEIAK